MTWAKTIAKARERGYFTLEERYAARWWPDCACGKQSKRIPRDPEGAPLDDELSDLGTGFAVAVEDHDFDQAERLLAAIQLRAAAVLARLRHAAEERALVEEALLATGWNVTAAARLLGLSRVGLTKKLKAIGLVRPMEGTP
jgi:DNA-binding NtrC family response regulator